jgi:hypothetical protein
MNMSRKEIPIITLAVFSISLVVMPAFITQSAYADTTIYSVGRNTGYFLGDNSGGNGFNEVVGERVPSSTSALAGKEFNKITVYLSKCGGCNSKALVYIGVWNFTLTPTSGNMLRQIAVVNSSDFSETAGTSLSFLFNGYTIPANGGVVIGVGRFTVATQADAAGANTTNAFNGTSTYLARYETSWVTNTAQDFAMKLELITEETVSGNNDCSDVSIVCSAFCETDGNEGLLRCRLEAGSGNALSGLVPANQNITSIGTTIGQGVGLIDPDNENPRTNGVGLFYMLITGSFFAIALMTTVHTLNMRGYISASVKEIDPIFWLFLVVATVSIAWYLDWIDDIIFAAMTVGLAGLVAFGVLKHFGRI